jgi:hypothetical protein
MKGRSKTYRGKWLPVAFVVTAAIALSAMSGSAMAGTIGSRPFGMARDASASPGFLLAGITSQNLPDWFKVSGDARTLSVAAIAVQVSCTSGSQFVLPDGFGRVPISKSGRLHDTFSQPPTAGSAGETYTWSDSITGRLNRRHTQLSGVWHLSVNYSFTNGMSDRCDSGPVRFIATL